MRPLAFLTRNLNIMTSRDIAIIGGTFNPVHKGHIMMAKYLEDNYIVDEVWMLPAYRPPHKNIDDICSYEDRCEMIDLCVESMKRVKVSEIEKSYYTNHNSKNEIQSTYTIDILNYITDKYKNIRLHFVVGFDEIYDIKTWHNYRELMKYYEFYIFDRECGDTKKNRIDFIVDLCRDFDFKFYYEILDAKIPNVSSTNIRELLKYDRNNKNKICELIDEKVYDYIIKNELYI